MSRKTKKGFLSIEFVIVGALILIVAAWMLFERYPALVNETSVAVNSQVTRFDKLPEGVNRITG